MKDPNFNNHEWTNISNNMGQILNYGIKVNEFGDHLICSNTQDIDVQTYRYGRWGHWRGYEGTTAFINPYSNACYFSGNGGDGLEGPNMDSWQGGFTMADVCTGSWYLRQASTNANPLYRIDDVGRTAIDITKNAGGSKVYQFTLSRENGESTLFIYSADRKVRRSTNNGDSFEEVITTDNDRSKGIAADPNHSNILYLGDNGTVWKYDLSKRNSKETVGTGLPQVPCDYLFFHEGSGDLYYGSQSYGVFIKEKDSETWRL